MMMNAIDILANAKKFALSIEDPYFRDFAYGDVIRGSACIHVQNARNIFDECPIEDPVPRTHALSHVYRQSFLFQDANGNSPDKRRNSLALPIYSCATLSRKTTF